MATIDYWYSNTVWLEELGGCLLILSVNGLKVQGGFHNRPTSPLQSSVRFVCFTAFLSGNALNVFILGFKATFIHSKDMSNTKIS